MRIGRDQELISRQSILTVFGALILVLTSSVALAQDESSPTDSLLPDGTLRPASDDLEALFPSELGGLPLEIQSFSGPEWIARYDDTTSGGAAAIKQTKDLVASTGKTIGDLTVAAVVDVPSSGNDASVAAVRVRGAEASEFVGRAIRLLLGDVGRPKLRKRTIAGKSVIRVSDASIPATYPRTIYPIGDTVWVVEAERSVLAEILAALPPLSDWGRVPFEAGLRDPDGASHINAVASGPKGIVAVGLAPTGAAAWYSTDGLTWRRAIPPRTWTTPGEFDWFPTIEDVVATESGFVAVGAEYSGAMRHRSDGTVWASSDGIEWRRTSRGVGPYLERIVEHKDQLFALSGGNRFDQAAIWASPDGRDWEQVFVAGEDTDIEVLASNGASLVAGDTQTMVTSTDGRTWTEAPMDQPQRVDDGITDVAAFDGGFLAVGSRDDKAAAWSSVDGLSWQEVPFLSSGGGSVGSLTALASLADGTLLAAANHGNGSGRLFGSTDGSNWELLMQTPDQGDELGGPLADLVVTPDAALLVGRYRDGPRGMSAAVWSDPAPVTVARETRASTACPGGRPTLPELLEMAPRSRVVCFGDKELSFRALLKEHAYPDLDYYASPHWLTAGVDGALALAVDGYPPSTLSLILNVNPGARSSVRLPLDRWALVTGHFDDRAARRCRQGWRQRCREAFVVTDTRRVSQD